MVRAGAEILINISNEAWFPDSAEYEQYHAIARFRAAEVRRSLVRVANSGISALIDPWGRAEAVEVRGDRTDVAGFLTGSLPLCDAITPYVRFGDWLCWACLAASALMAAIARPYGRALR
jgi:apolipoprotein N-acyltransferase